MKYILNKWKCKYTRIDSLNDIQKSRNRNVRIISQVYTKDSLVNDSDQMFKQSNCKWYIFIKCKNT